MCDVFQALASAGEGTRSLIFIGESAVNNTTLANIEALRCAQSPHAIPATMLPSVQTQHMMESEYIYMSAYHSKIMLLFTVFLGSRRPFGTLIISPCPDGVIGVILAVL